MTGTRGGHDQHTSATEMRAPTQIDVVADMLDRGVEAADRSKEVGAHHHAGGRHSEHVAHRIVLFLVELTGLD